VSLDAIGSPASRDATLRESDGRVSRRDPVTGRRSQTATRVGAASSSSRAARLPTSRVVSRRNLTPPRLAIRAVDKDSCLDPAPAGHSWIRRRPRPDSAGWPATRRPVEPIVNATNTLHRNHLSLIGVRARDGAQRQGPVQRAVLIPLWTALGLAGRHGGSRRRMSSGNWASRSRRSRVTGWGRETRQACRA